MSLAEFSFPRFIATTLSTDTGHLWLDVTLPESKKSNLKIKIHTFSHKTLIPIHCIDGFEWGEWGADYFPL